jgi:hypothetical protein
MERLSLLLLGSGKASDAAASAIQYLGGIPAVFSLQREDWFADGEDGVDLAGVRP